MVVPPQIALVGGPGFGWTCLLGTMAASAGQGLGLLLCSSMVRWDQQSLSHCTSGGGAQCVRAGACLPGGSVQAFRKPQGPKEMPVHVAGTQAWDLWASQVLFQCLIPACHK